MDQRRNARAGTRLPCRDVVAERQGCPLRRLRAHHTGATAGLRSRHQRVELRRRHGSAAAAFSHRHAAHRRQGAGGRRPVRPDRAPPQERGTVRSLDEHLESGARPVARADPARGDVAAERQGARDRRTRRAERADRDRRALRPGDQHLVERRHLGARTGFAQRNPAARSVRAGRRGNRPHPTTLRHRQRAPQQRRDLRSRFERLDEHVRRGLRGGIGRQQRPTRPRVPRHAAHRTYGDAAGRRDGARCGRYQPRPRRQRRDLSSGEPGLGAEQGPCPRRASCTSRRCSRTAGR